MSNTTKAGMQIMHRIAHLFAAFFAGLLWSIRNSPSGVRNFIYLILTPYRVFEDFSRKIAKLGKRESEYQIYLTGKTLTYGGQIYQLSNITYIGKRKLVRTNWLEIFIWRVLLIVGSIGSCIIYLISVPDWYPLSLLSIPFAAIVLVNVTYAIYKKLLIPTYFVKLETSAASTELFMSKDESFIDELIFKIRDSINKPDPKISYIFNTIDKSINTSGGTYVGGNVNTGGDFIGRDKLR